MSQLWGDSSSPQEHLQVMNQGWFGSQGSAGMSFLGCVCGTCDSGSRLNVTLVSLYSFPSSAAWNEGVRADAFQIIKLNTEFCHQRMMLHNGVLHCHILWCCTF